LNLRHKHIASTRENNDICYNKNIIIEIIYLATDCTVFGVINERTNEIHISWLMLCAGVTFQLALVCARKYAS
jgi:hypothetical protein